MNRSTLTLGFLLSLAALGLAACGKNSDTPKAVGDPAAIKTDDQKVSYGLGYNMGKNLAREKVLQVDRTALQAGIEDGLAGAKVRLTEPDMKAAFTAMQQRAEAAQVAEAGKQLTAGKEFLAKNKAKAGVKTTSTGLQYEVLKKGSGPKPKTSNTVKVHYHGTLIDGTVFDSSVQRGEPIEFALTGVIPGWVEALQLMSVGDKWKLTLPPEIAYGSQGKGSIPPNAVLVFEVELLGIK